jgi:hypothetical protein
MNEIGPLLEDGASVDFGYEEAFLAALPDPHPASMFSLGMQPRERIDSEEFEEGSFRKNSKVFLDGQSQTSPFDVVRRPPGTKHKKRRLPASSPDQLYQKKLQFPFVNRRKKVAKVTAKNRLASRHPLSKTGQLPSTLRHLSAKPCPARPAKRVPKQPKSRCVPTLESLVSCSGENKSTRDTCTSLTPKAKLSLEVKPATPFRGMEKLQTKITKLRSFWIHRNRIQPQIFRFLVYDYDTRKLNCEFVDHSLKGILMEPPLDNAQEPIEVRPKEEPQGFAASWEEPLRRFFPFED